MWITLNRLPEQSSVPMAQSENTSKDFSWKSKWPPKAPTNLVYKMPVNYVPIKDRLGKKRKRKKPLPNLTVVTLAFEQIRLGPPVHLGTED
ncbi:hypothetical protein TNCV_2017201 [Trichonephila clavipes]|nr:hypothetical protein TNCV_2017201 [Trichonephila clavipes]